MHSYGLKPLRDFSQEGDGLLLADLTLGTNP